MSEIVFLTPSLLYLFIIVLFEPPSVSPGIQQLEASYRRAEAELHRLQQRYAELTAENYQLELFVRSLN